MNNNYNTFYKALNITVDYLLLNISLIFTSIVLDNSTSAWYSNKHYFQLALIFNFIWLLSANISGLYTYVLNRDSINTFRSIIKTYILHVSLICIIIIFVIGTEAYFIKREFLFYSTLLFGALLCLWKLVMLAFRKLERARLDDSKKVIIVGAGHSASELINLFKTHVLRGYNILGVFDDDPLKVDDGEIYLGNTNSCIDYILQHKVNEIFCTLPYSQNRVIETLMVLADKNLIRFRLVPEYHGYIKKTIQVQNFGNIPVISFRQEPLESMLNRGMKRLFDVVFSLLIIVFIFSWLFPILALLIKLESKGPIFFVQRRSGRDNKSFNCYKFRSMYVNAESDHKQAIKGDARITKTGTFFRKLNIDELPQFFNVLVGNMSTVGPRPHMISHTEQYAKLIDTFMVRHFLKPGITGWAQINGLRGETKTTQAMLERVEADVWYLENWSFLLDLKIVFLTIWNIIKGDKNAF